MQLGHNQIKAEVANCKILLKIMNTADSAINDVFLIIMTIIVSEKTEEGTKFNSSYTTI